MKKSLSFEVGKKYGRLTVVGVRPETGKKTVCVCDCSCGNRVEKIPSDLRRGFVVSCGCQKNEQAIARNKAKTKHGATASGSELLLTYRSWTMMVHRCTNEKMDCWERYGGRGIAVCERWKKFENFVEDMGLRPSPDHTIDRIDNNGNYELDNCRWATDEEQRRNKRSTVWVQCGEKRLPLVDACRLMGINYSTAQGRVARGQPFNVRRR